MASKREVAAACMEHLCNHEWHGYTWGDRWGDGEGVCDVVVDGITYQVEQGDRDCSSANISAYEAAGIDCGGAVNTYTMRERMCATGNFRWHPTGDGYVAKRGDSYLSEENHTAMCLGDNPDILGEFSANEFGGCYGGQVGDQTGWESHICDYYNYPWDGILEYIGDNEGNTSGNTQTALPADAPQNIRFRVHSNGEDNSYMNGHVDEGGSTDNFGGVFGKEIKDIDFENLGPNGWFQFTLTDGTVLARNQHNTTNLFIIGVTIYYDTPNPGATGYYRAAYQVHILGGDWLKVEYDDEDGGAGNDQNVIDALRLTIEKM